MNEPLKRRDGSIRTCTRCKMEPAMGRVKSEYLGPICLRKRRERQWRESERQRTIKRCHCGACIRDGSRLCENCQEAEYESVELSGLIGNVHEAAVPDAIKDAIVFLLEKCRED